MPQKLTLNDLKPNHFTSRPMDSIMQKSEAETIASNILRIMARTGNEWNLTWKKYKEERLMDAGFSDIEKSYFDDLYPRVNSVIGAINFARAWANDAKNATA